MTRHRCPPVVTTTTVIPVRRASPKKKGKQLEHESGAQLNLARVPNPRNEATRGFPKQHAPAIAYVPSAEVGIVQQVERLDEHADSALSPQSEELRRAQIHNHRAVAAASVDPDLIAGRRIHPPVVVGPVSVQIGA